MTSAASRVLSLAISLLVGCSQQGVAGRGGCAGSGRNAGGSTGNPVAGARVIVVLGSSTSAGTGPKHPKNAWVPRYQAFLASEFPNFAIVNLAVGGQTTYHIQPTGFVPPPGRPQPVTDKNITTALALHPSALFINMPSNDAAASIPKSEQLANYQRILQLTAAQNIPVWITTTQPRNFDSAAQIRIQIEMRDAVHSMFAPRAVDFWTPFATAQNTIKPEYDSGDGVHMNDQAHALLAGIVEAARLPEHALAP